MCAAPDRLQQFAATAASTGGEAFGECSSLGRRSAHLKQSCSAFGGRERGARQRRSNFDEVAAPARGARATSKAAAIEKVMKVINTLTAGTIDLRYARSMEIRTGFTPGFFFCQKHVTMRQVSKTGTRCRCRFLPQLSQCKNAPKTPGLI